MLKDCNAKIYDNTLGNRIGGFHGISFSLTYQGRYLIEIHNFLIHCIFDIHLNLKTILFILSSINRQFAIYFVGKMGMYSYLIFHFYLASFLFFIFRQSTSMHPWLSWNSVCRTDWPSTHKVLAVFSSSILCLKCVLIIFIILLKSYIPIPVPTFSPIPAPSTSPPQPDTPSTLQRG